MKKIILLSLIVSSIMGFTDSKNNSSFTPVAVIELFTSQGCSSCPAADRLLSKTLANARKNDQAVIALSFHVDYWNRLGWKDPFSEKEYSERQNNYASTFNLNSVYTPQVIVNGAKEFVGSNETQLKASIGNFLKDNPDAQFKSISAEVQNNSPKVKFTLEGDYADCIVNIALIALKETTSIQRGENAGEVLTGENIVRQFISIPAKASGEVELKPIPLPAINNRAIIAYIQRHNDMKIVGGVMTEIK
ncbi:MAG: DUF1223 domain-containing protein [Saprospiraceae bacterium]